MSREIEPFCPFPDVPPESELPAMEPKEGGATKAIAIRALLESLRTLDFREGPNGEKIRGPMMFDLEDAGRRAFGSPGLAKSAERIVSALLDFVHDRVPERLFEWCQKYRLSAPWAGSLAICTIHLWWRDQEARSSARWALPNVPFFPIEGVPGSSPEPGVDGYERDRRKGGSARGSQPRAAVRAEWAASVARLRELGFEKRPDLRELDAHALLLARHLRGETLVALAGDRPTRHAQRHAVAELRGRLGRLAELIELDLSHA